MSAGNHFNRGLPQLLLSPNEGRETRHQLCLEQQRPCHGGGGRTTMDCIGCAVNTSRWHHKDHSANKSVWPLSEKLGSSHWNERGCQCCLELDGWDDSEKRETPWKPEGIQVRWCTGLRIPIVWDISALNFSEIRFSWYCALSTYLELLPAWWKKEPVAQQPVQHPSNTQGSRCRPLSSLCHPPTHLRLYPPKHRHYHQCHFPCSRPVQYRKRWYRQACLIGQILAREEQSCPNELLFKAFG